MIVGVDEVGRGPLFGSVVAAACILPAEYELAGLNDSKKLNEVTRERLAEEIKAQAVGWAIAEASVQEIDQINILQASLLAMHRAVDKLNLSPEIDVSHVMVDGNKLPKWHYSAEAVVGGDGKVAVISAASILAKVFRDKQMENFALEYPQYGLESHKGYPTKKHLQALEEHGVTIMHRRSFGPVRKLLAESDLFGEQWVLIVNKITFTFININYKQNVD